MRMNATQARNLTTVPDRSASALEDVPPLDGHPITQSTDDVQVAACQANRVWRATSAPHVLGPKATRSKNS
jgi:hypothetical protein